MSEWLTTGEMIDRLKVGEEAETHPDDVYVRVKRFENGIYRMYVVGGESTGIVEGDEGPLRLNDMYIKLRWRILPRYVSFEEAMKALMNGKTVWLWEDGKKKKGYYLANTGSLWCIAYGQEDEVDEILFGHKWTIEE
jgi:hypothetical protein